MDNKIQKRALLIIDVQNEYFTGKLPVTYPENSFENILKVIDNAKDENIPVVVVQHSSSTPNTPFEKGSIGWELHDQIKSIEYDYYIEKTLPSSFSGTGLQEWLEKSSIDTVVIAGYMTQMCCDTTSRYAMHLGYKVEFLSDATGTLSIENNAGKVSAEELHRSILVTQSMRFSEVLSSNMWIEKVKNK